ncbi:MAG TPA: hypothetical protein VGH28_04715 [Polyangiaceae bacterium]|jgi:hypothetical protein
MKTPVDARLADEAQRFRFRFTCDDCRHFQSERCGDGWSTDEHRLPLAHGGVVVFCKEFEMGP